MKNYTQLTMIDRQRLCTFLQMGLPKKQIAERLSKDKSTIYREINRNKEKDGYFPGIAQQKARARNQQGRFNKLEKNILLHEYVIRGLKKGWSPEQISGRMRLKKIGYYACHETIYQYIYTHLK